MLTRRDLLRGRAPRSQGPEAGLAIHPRSDWADRDPVGPLEAEAPGDVRVLLVHHSVNDNTYAASDVPGMLRSIFGFHTGSDKGWPDVAYNFFVDRFGGVWEGRAGSLTSPVKGDATGGSQGFAQLCCFLGDHRTEPPSPQAQDAMILLLGRLAGQYGIDVTAGATTTFTSRGSNLFPAGTSITTPTIAGHRDMTATECPGDAAYALVTGRFRQEVALGVPAPSPPPTTTAPPPPTTTTTPPTTPTTPPTTTTTPPTTSTAPSTTAPEDLRADATVTTTGGGSDGRGWWPAGGVVAGTLAAVAAVVGGAIALRRRSPPG